MVRHPGLRTWIEIDTNALKCNIATFRKIIGPKVKLMAVVKSNAYGHGFLDFAKKVEKFQNGVDWYAVDSVVEAFALRRVGSKKPILVLGYTLPELFGKAAKRNISLTISTFESIKALKKLNRSISRRPNLPRFHIEIDTGMHRQGFLPHQIGQVISEIRNWKLEIRNSLQGVYTHFSSAKDPTYPFYTKEQIKKFDRACLEFEAAGFMPFLRHAAATGGAILYPEAHYDMVRIGIGIYGLWPSKAIMLQKELRAADGKSPIAGLNLKPILAWKALASEVKHISKGAYVGYDLTEKTMRSTKLAICPVGYWHGVDRGLSSIGQVLIRGKRAKMFGRVSMDMIAVDATNIADIKPGDIATLIGKDGKEEITAYEWAEKLNTTHYEILTRINPLIKRIYL